MPSLVVLALLTSALDTACQAGLDCGSGARCDDSAGGSAVPSGGNLGLTTAGSNAGGVANLGGGVSAHAGSSGAPASDGGSVANGGSALGGNGGAIGGNGGAIGGNSSAGTPSRGGASGSTGSGGSAGSMAAAGSGGKASGGGAGSGGVGGGGPSSGTAGSGGASSGGAGSSGVSGSGGSGQVDPYASARQTCVDRVNQLRASKGLGAIPRLASAESCADGQAKTDSQTGMAHSAFNACLSQVQGWTGAAQNECPGWGSVADTLSGCIDAMWGEGPGGGHYDNMVGDYDDMACGFYTTPQGKVWMVQDFWRK